MMLALLMVAILLATIREVPLEPSERFWIVMATLALAALSSWIISFTGRRT
jgi:hypothetical protein